MSEVAPGKTRLLVVDDSVLMRKAASKMLGEEFDVVVAKDGVEGWETLAGDTSIQVVFTDLNMPRMDGYELLQKIRAADDDGTVNMPVIVVTGADDDEVARKKALDLGATDFITKPFGSIDLLARARAHANYRRIAQRLEKQITLDELTGLSNRAGFIDRLQQDLAYARRHGAPLTLVRIEIDGFRDLFLRHGKALAERLILHVAGVLRERVRKEDSAARMGLAGFALALPAGQHEGSKGLVERLRSEIAAHPPCIDEQSIALTISAAVCSPQTQYELDAVSALEEAEALLKRASAEGGNRVLGVCTEQESEPEADPAQAPDGLGVDLDKLDAMLHGDAPSAATPPTKAPPPQLPEPPEQRDPAGPEPPPARAVPPPPAPSAPSHAASQPSSANVASASSAEVPISVDAALFDIEAGRVRAAAERLPQLVRRLLPLLRLLSDRQRAQLIGFLQKLG